MKMCQRVPLERDGYCWGKYSIAKGPTYFAGDLSGIQQKNIPFWFQGLGLYKPGKKLRKKKTGLKN